MANKRMFTMKIVDSDAFLDMPLSTQCLYFHLNMRADDDGFIGNPKKVMKIVGASDDDLKLLIAKRFVLCFEDGVIVIKHWRMHNTLSQNRYHETQYVDEKSMLKLKENGSYSFENGEEIDDKKLINAKEKYDKKETACKRLANGLQTADSDLDLDLDLDLGLDKDLDKELNTPPISPSQGDADTEKKKRSNKKEKQAERKHHYGEYKHVMLTDGQLDKLFEKYGNEKTHEAIKYLDEYIEMKGKKYKNHYLAMIKWVFEAVEEKKKRKNRGMQGRQTAAEMINENREMLADWAREMEEKENDI